MSKTDPSQNYMQRHPQPLDAIFQPNSVAVIGAKDDPGSVGNTIMHNLTDQDFGGKVYPVNPKRKEVLGLKAYPDISSVPGPVDLAIVVTPAKTVPGIIAQCVEAGVRGAIVISAGFKELGPSGAALEEKIVHHARRGNMPVIGPNCLGVMNPINGLNATFAKGMALPGNIAFISQSGAMCTAVLDWSFREKIGFSSFVSIGSMADVNWGDLIDYLGNDPQTHCILAYMETVGDPRAFLTAAREIAFEKPIIVIKAGRSEAAAEAAASHTGSLAGSDAVFDAALQRAGVLRVYSIGELFSMAAVLARQPRPKGPNLTIITNAGGPAVLATDATVLNGAELTPIKGGTLDQLNGILPEAWSHGNPVDILGDAGAQTYADTLEILSQDPTTDGLLVVLSPQDMTDATGTAIALKKYANMKRTPLLTSWMGGDSVAEGVKILTEAGIPNFEYPDDAAHTFAAMWRYTQNIRLQYETPAVRDLNTNYNEIKRQKEAQAIVEEVHKENRTLLNEFESKRVLSAYGIPVVETRIATTSEGAVKQAQEIGFPVALKIHSQTITHKSDVGGVKLNLESPKQVTQAFQDIHASVSRIAGEEHFEGVTVQKMIKLEGDELILGSTTDPQFGPVLLFGAGGRLVEVFKDRALGLPPLNSTLARRLMEKTKVYEVLKGVRGREAIDLEALEGLLVQFSRMVVENPWIKECDINPLLASPSGLIALDSRIVLHDPNLKELPKPAIRPYPIDYVLPWKLKEGDSVILRPICPEDEPQMTAFHKELSETSVRQRFFEFLELSDRIAHERLVRICYNDYDRELAIVAETKEHKIIGVARISRIPGTQDAVLTLLISDAYHRKGLGTRLVGHLIHIAEKEGIQTLLATILSENVGMLHICKQYGFECLPNEKDATLIQAVKSF